MRTKTGGAENARIFSADCAPSDDQSCASRRHKVRVAAESASVHVLDEAEGRRGAQRCNQRPEQAAPASAYCERLGDLKLVVVDVFSACSAYNCFLGVRVLASVLAGCALAVVRS